MSYRDHKVVQVQQYQRFRFGKREHVRKHTRALPQR